MKKEEAKTTMLRIMHDLPKADEWEKILSVIAVHLGLNERDCEEVMNRFFNGEDFSNSPTFPDRNMEKEEARTIMLRIMHDFPFAHKWADIFAIISEHLGLDERDSEEVMNRFNKELHNAYINSLTFPKGNRAKVEKEKRKRY